MFFFASVLCCVLHYLLSTLSSAFVSLTCLGTCLRHVFTNLVQHHLFRVVHAKCLVVETRSPLPYLSPPAPRHPVLRTSKNSEPERHALNRLHSRHERMSLRSDEMRQTSGAGEMRVNDDMRRTSGASQMPGHCR